MQKALRMKCLRCQFENREGVKFCEECGARIEIQCPSCGALILMGKKFCGECGQRFKEVSEVEKEVPESGAERKHITVLFSDLSGYTAMSEKLDPEEVKDITTKIFSEITQVIDKYDGFIEKFVGDAVMALFGVPKAHEDDPIRAIRAAREIHDLVDSESPELEKRIGHPLSMHTGINTGLVVTGEVDMEKGTHGLAGGSINLAARLSSLSKPGDIVVGPDTFLQAQGYFTFENLGPTKVKGKTEPVEIYKVLSPKEKPSKIHRPLGLRSDLIGRTEQMAQLGKAVERLKKANGSILSLCGDPGTGKSRLIEEFKATLDLDKIQWREGHAFAYSQNIPYFPLIDLLSRSFQIDEGDPPERVREKVESNVKDLVGEKEGVVPYVGELFSLSYPATEDASPEFWKARLYEAVKSIFSALAKRAPTIICLEDLHWADPSFLDLCRSMLSKLEDPILFLCVYRPLFSLLSGNQLSDISIPYQEIRLQDLSPTETQDMVASLLKADFIPPELERFVQERVEGNPFYLEEVINNLIDSETLIRDNGSWKLTRPIIEAEVPSTIHGVISARLDRLKKEMKRMLQEASVIGRSFLYEILKQVTELKDQCERCLIGLERLDLIRTKAIQPDLEYIFKHALTQEVVYNGLLKKERQEIHERIANVMEHLFQERLSEFYETLAFHFKQGQSIHKAVDYLMKSGEKSLRRYAVEESHQYFQEGFNLLADKPERTKEENELLIDLLVKWALVFYYRGDAIGLVNLLLEHESLAVSLDDKERLGMLYAWLGYVLFWREKYRESYTYLMKARKLGKETKNMKVEGYACTWLPYTCAELGLLDEGMVYGQRAREISGHFESDRYLFIKPISGMGYIHFFTGMRKSLIECSKIGIDYGHQNSDIRSLGMGYTGLGLSYLIAGDFDASIEYCKKAVSLSADPLYSMAFTTMLSLSYLYGGQFKQAEESAHEVLAFTRKYGVDWLGTMVQLVLSVVSIAKGEMSQGLGKLKEVQKACITNESRWLYAQTEYIMGSVYLQIVQGSGPKSLSILVKNIGFLVKNVPPAGRKAEQHFNKAINMAKEIGANGILGQTYLDLGLLHKAKKRIERARECFSEAIRIFEQCEADVFLKKAREALASLE
jgi:class 3 adenylate cyclase/tetratricopeptide (TPR) repeat protein